MLSTSCATLRDQQVDEQKPDAQQPGEKPADKRQVKRPASSQPENWVSEVERRQLIEKWEIRGRLGFQTDTNGGSLDVTWKQFEREYSIRLIAPLGAGNYHVQGDDTFAEILFPDGHREILNNIEDAFSSILNVELPVSAIKDWVRGTPSRTMPVKNPRWNESGLLTNIEQSGWRVEMKKYTGSEIPLPHAIYLSRDDDEELDIRLVLRQWLVDN